MEVKAKLQKGIMTLDRCRAKGVQKCWALHHILLYQIRWDLMVYEIPLFFIESLETFVSKFIRKWLGVSRNISDVALYSKHSPCVFPFNNLCKYVIESLNIDHH